MHHVRDRLTLLLGLTVKERRPLVCPSRPGSDTNVAFSGLSTAISASYLAVAARPVALEAHPTTTEPIPTSYHSKVTNPGTRVHPRDPNRCESTKPKPPQAKSLPSSNAQSYSVEPT